MSAKNAADAFYTGELESELRQIGMADVCFKADSDREKYMELVGECRRDTIYPHLPTECSPSCIERGRLHAHLL